MAIADLGLPWVLRSSGDMSTSSRPATQSIRPRSRKLSERAQVRKRSRSTIPGGISIPSAWRGDGGSLRQLGHGRLRMIVFPMMGHYVPAVDLLELAGDRLEFPQVS